MDAQSRFACHDWSAALLILLARPTEQEMTPLLLLFHPFSLEASYQHATQSLSPSQPLISSALSTLCLTLACTLHSHWSLLPSLLFISSVTTQAVLQAILWRRTRLAASKYECSSPASPSHRTSHHILSSYLLYGLHCILATISLAAYNVG